MENNGSLEPFSADVRIIIDRFLDAIPQHLLGEVELMERHASTKLLAFLPSAATKMGSALVLTGLFQRNLTAGQ
jgi:hypothetical protein